MPSAAPAPEPVLETARLILRIPQRDDFAGWAALGEDAAAMRFLGGVKPRFETWKHFLATVGAWHVQGFAPFSVIEKSSGRWIGRVGPLRPEDWPGDEIGWTLAREAWGNGYATEAATAAADWAFANLGWSEIIHCIAPDNAPSQAVAARLGSVKRGQGRLPPPNDKEPIDIWGQTRDEWLTRRTTHSS
ncbi:MAG: Acetyltransferase, GNAT family [Rhodanobacteraceae bacterium]|jgi:RimJ/RimL family protein N-acetyltransferase|nr:MAG: Acetyltransferase, GNAT family [Rhodanobacteraceae bacterium]